MRVFSIVLFALSISENAGNSNNSVEGSLSPLMKNTDYFNYVALASLDLYFISGGIMISEYWVLSSNFQIEIIEFVYYGSSTYASSEYIQQKYVAIDEKHNTDHFGLVKVEIQFNNNRVPKLPNQKRCKDLKNAKEYLIIFWNEDSYGNEVFSTFIEDNTTLPFDGKNKKYYNMNAGSVIVINDAEIYGVKLGPRDPFMSICNSIQLIENMTKPN